MNPNNFATLNLPVSISGVLLDDRQGAVCPAERVIPDPAGRRARGVCGQIPRPETRHPGLPPAHVLSRLLLPTAAGEGALHWTLRQPVRHRDAGSSGSQVAMTSLFYSALF